MKFLTTLAILGLIGFAASQTTTNGAGQCVQCQYWGGNWCPANTTQGLPTASANGVCNAALTSCSSGTLASNPSLCTLVTGHAVKATCPDITADSMNSTK